MITTTLNRIRAHGPCSDGWQKLLKGLGKASADDEPLPFARIVEINGIDDAVWCCRAEPQYAREWRLLAVWCARRVEHLLTDQRSRDALDVAERFANGRATDDELAAARAAAWDAARDAARVAARVAAWVAERAAERAAEMAASWVAAWVAERAAERAASWAAARADQTKEFLRVVTETEAKP